jgi:hypothetical protein
VEASRKLIDEDAKWEDFVVPFVCMVGATEAEEIEQFYVVNSRAKSVRTDLALLLLRTIADRDPKMLERWRRKVATGTCRPRSWWKSWLTTTSSGAA